MPPPPQATPSSSLSILAPTSTSPLLKQASLNTPTNLSAAILDAREDTPSVEQGAGVRKERRGESVYERIFWQKERKTERIERGSESKDGGRRAVLPLFSLLVLVLV